MREAELKDHHLIRLVHHTLLYDALFQKYYKDEEEKRETSVISTATHQHIEHVEPVPIEIRKQYAECMVLEGVAPSAENEGCTTVLVQELESEEDEG